MKLDTMEQISENFAKSLVNKHIHFTCHSREDNTIETMPGKVLNYNNIILEIDTTDIMYDDQSNSESNRLIKKISIDDISDVLVFDKYTKEFWNILDSIDEELKSKRFEILVSLVQFPLEPPFLINKINTLLSECFFNHFITIRRQIKCNVI